FQAELAEVLATHRERVEIVLVQISPEFPAPLLVFAPSETSRQEKERRDNRRDHVDPDLALQCANHAMSPIERSTRLRLTASPARTYGGQAMVTNFQLHLRE